MSSLGVLNLSYNNLQEKLDSKFSHWPDESFEGNQQLCGSPLDHCNRDDASSRDQSGLTASSVVLISAISTLPAVALFILAFRAFFRNKPEHFKRDSVYA
ncbi:hypothetical protein HN873_047662 [Arachis hypogaea]